MRSTCRPDRSQRFEDAVKALSPRTDFSRSNSTSSGRKCRPVMRADGSRRRANDRMRQMSEVTCYVALPFVPSDHGIALGEAIECSNPNSAVMKAEALSRKPRPLAPSRPAAQRDPATGTSATPADPEIRRRAERPERAVRSRLNYPSSECSRKKRSISLVASGPRGSV